MVTGQLLWQWTAGHLLEYGGGGGLGVRLFYESYAGSPHIN
jgi:hypothetical protein